jgi:hypothetical protein
LQPLTAKLLREIIEAIDIPDHIQWILRLIKYRRCFLVPKTYVGVRCVKEDLVVLPKALKETQGSMLAITVLRGKLQNFGESSVSVDGRRAVRPRKSRR